MTQTLFDIRMQTMRNYGLERLYEDRESDPAKRQAMLEKPCRDWAARFDPYSLVVLAGAAEPFDVRDRLHALRARLLPFVTVLTPNASEARRLVQGAAGDLDACAAALLADGCQRVLITGGDEHEVSVINRCYGFDAAPRLCEWPRLPETFHGAGCTLASAIAARLALGDSTDEAIDAGQRWTQGALARAVAVGSGRRIPGRFIE